MTKVEFINILKKMNMKKNIKWIFIRTVKEIEKIIEILKIKIINSKNNKIL